LYLKRIRKEDDINFIIAGHIVHLAWSILKLQSKDVLFNADREEEYYFQDWDVDEIYENPEDIDYVHEVLQHPKPAIQEMIRREEKRQITLMELVDAFDDAVPNFRDKVHKENLQQDIALTWQKICKLNDDVMPFHYIHNGKPNERIGAFVSILYLVQMKKINICQKVFPCGEILITNLVPKDNRKIESEILINELFDESSNEVLIKDLAVI
jgi:segregation and condensation protein A